MDAICFYEEEPELFDPLVWFRPVCDLRAGSFTLLERARKAWPGASIHVAARSMLADEWRERTGQALNGEIRAAGTLFLAAGCALTPSAVAAIERHPPGVRFTREGRLFGAKFPPDDGTVFLADRSLAGELERVTRRFRAEEIELVCVRELADFLRHGDALLRGDLAMASGARVRTDLEGGVRVLGEFPVLAAPTVRIDPGTVLDARLGPIGLAEGVVVSFGSWVVGPSSIGPGTTLLGGTIGPNVGTGPACRICGELTDTFVQGYANKAHGGFVGHSLLGEWVNLGASTTVSNLKNNYSSVRLEVNGKAVDTGLRKCGVFLGDHVKTAIGTLMGAGTSIGPGANVFGAAGTVPKTVPGFAWGAAGERRSYDLERFLEVAERVASRRDRTLGPAYRELARAVHRAC